MTQIPKTVALLTDNPALSSILGSTLASCPSWRVRAFAQVADLATYLRIASLDVLVCDYSVDSEIAAEFVPDLRETPGIVNPTFQVIALSRVVTPAMKGICFAAGIEEVIVKPASPKYVLERVAARLAAKRRRLAEHAFTGSVNSGLFQHHALAAAPAERAYADNVVPLFPGMPLRAR